MIGKGKLFISGGGHAHESYLLDSLFVQSLIRKKLLYIPLGLQRDFIGYDECYEWIVRTLGQHSDEPLDIEMWIDLSHHKTALLQNVDAVYIGGAKHSYELAQLFHRSEFAAALVNLVSRGGSLYGGSAGAAVIGKNVAFEHFGHDATFRFHPGLELIAEYSICCHYLPEQNPAIRKFSFESNAAVIAIPENSGLFVEKNEVKVVGYGSVAIFDVPTGTRILEPEHSFLI